MSKRKKSNKKLTHSLAHIIRKVFKENPDSTLNHKQVCAMINVKESAIRKLVYSILEDLSKKEILKKAGYNIYQLNHNESFLERIIQMTARKAGFVVVNDPEVEDIFIPPHSINQAIGGDLVKIQITKQGKKRPEGVVLEVIERERSQFVGTIQMHDNYAFLIPDNPRVGTDIFIQKEKLKGAKEGDKAIAEITVWPKSAQSP